MAHEITSTDRAMFNRTPAWHGLGDVVDRDMNAAEGLGFLGMDWTVSSRPLFAQVEQEGMQVMRAVETHKAQVRDDNGDTLGVVGEGFRTVQNSELAALADALAGEGGCTVESMGSLRGGRRVWILAKGASFDIGKGDEHAPYLVLANGHDGSMSLRALPTTVRVVCANTLALALEGRAGGYTFRHTAGLSVRLDDVRAALRNWGHAIEADRARAASMAEHRLTRDQVQDLWLGAIMRADGPITMDPKTPAEERRRARVESSIAHMARVFDAEASRFGANAYTAVNAATHWIQHERGRLEGEARAASRLFGDYAQMSADVFRSAERMLATA